MKLKICFFLLAFILSLNPIFAQNATTQTTQLEEPSRFEVGAQFTSLSANPSRVGVGGRFTVNLNRNFAFEAEGNVFPSRRFDGRAALGLFGVKIGRRYDKFGVFAKARPGLFYQSQGRYDYVLRSNASSTDPFPYDLRTKSQTSFALDVGGVAEFYPTKHLVTRFDLGDTIIVTPPRTVNFPVFGGNTPPVLQTVRLSTRTTHNFQFSAGIGFRF